MTILILAGILGLLLAALGVLLWGILRAFQVRNAGRRIARSLGFAYPVVLVVVLLCGLPLGAAWLLAYSGTRPQDLDLTVTPTDYGLHFEDVGFLGRDGERLSGWWMEGERGRPAFVLVHGLFRDRREVLERACRLNQLGFGALLFDLRRHGASGGEKVSLGYRERLDVLAAIRFAAVRGSERIVPLGVSMGAVATLEAVGEMGPEVVCIIADSPFLSLEETVARHVKLFFGLPSFPFVNFFVWNFSRINGFRASQLDLQKSLAETPPVPVLLIYGTEDRRMPGETAEAVLKSIPSREKRLVFFPGASHGEAWKSDPDRYLKIVLDFVAEHSQPGLPDDSR